MCRVGLRRVMSYTPGFRVQRVPTLYISPTLLIETIPGRSDGKQRRERIDTRADPYENRSKREPTERIGMRKHRGVQAGGTGNQNGSRLISGYQTNTCPRQQRHTKEKFSRQVPINNLPILNNRHPRHGDHLRHFPRIPR
jgi:hypothetical protein